jgi:diguanylate cyclase (GGDEF)-like protein/PAS domain S-box-containing protein
MSLLLGILPTLFPLISLFGCYVVVVSFGFPANTFARQALLGTLFSAAMCLILARPFMVSAGVILDSRGAVLATAMLFGGPWVGIATTITGILYRLYLGGAGAWAGVWGLALNAGGLLLYFHFYRNPVLGSPKAFFWQLATLGAWSGLCEALSLFLVTPYAYGLQLALSMGWALAFFQLASMLALGSLMYLHQQNSRLLLELNRSETERLWVADHAAEVIAVFGESNEPLYVSTSARHALGEAADSPDLRQRIDPEGLQLLDLELARLRTGQVEHSQFNLIVADGQGYAHTVEASLSRLDGTDLRIMLMLRDQSAIRQTAQALEASERKFRGIFDQAAVGIALLSPEGRWLQVNQRLCEIVGYSESELLHKTFQDITHPEDLGKDLKLVAQLLAGEISTYTLEKRYFRKNGELTWVELTVALVRDHAQQPSFFISVVDDINQRKNAEAQILNLAYYDTLTELPNRRLLQDRLQHARVSSARNEEWCAIFFLDLDHFKTLNDTQGHDAGDQLLIQVAHRLTAGLRAADTVARLGGDEFVILLENLGTSENQAAQEAEALAEKIRDAISQPFTLCEKAEMHYTSSSIGISLFQGEQIGMDEILKHADMALYQAKEGGRNTIRFFDTAVQYAMEISARLQVALHGGLVRNEFQLFCQAQVGSNEEVTGGEILLRWQHADGDWISPAQFIPLAEETGAIHEIGHWVLLKTCETLVEWSHDPQLAPLTLSVNVSARQFIKPDFIPRLLQMLVFTGVNPARLKLELTESIFAIKDPNIVSHMQSLCAQGIVFALDDFGTGYSPLSYLKHLPFQQLKIDQGFVQGVPEDPDSCAIVQAILSMGHSLGMEIIAEGVETEAQHQFLSQHGCKAFQGFHFARPQALPEFCAMKHGEPSHAS